MKIAEDIPALLNLTQSVVYTYAKILMWHSEHLYKTHQGWKIQF